MGLLTLNEMKTEIRAAFGNTTTYDSRLTSLLNMAQDRLVARHDFEELKVRDTIGTTADTGDASADMVIALPGTLRQLYSVAVIDGANSRKLTRVPSALWDATIPYAEAFTRGKPDKYRRWGNSIELWRVPDATYTLRGHWSKWATALADATPTGTSDLERKDQLLILLVLVWLSALADRPDRANYFWSIFKTVYEESFGVSVYEADLNKSDTDSGSSIDDYWKDPMIKSYSSEQVE